MPQLPVDVADPDVDEAVVLRGPLEYRHASDPRSGKNGFPGIRFIAGHVVSGVIARHRHERHQIGFPDFLFHQHLLDVADFRIAFDRAYEDVGVLKLQLKHTILQLLVIQHLNLKVKSGHKSMKKNLIKNLKTIPLMVMIQWKLLLALSKKLSMKIVEKNQPEQWL